VLINDIRALLPKDKNPLVKAPKGEESKDSSIVLV
jgi:hypothetical protein